MNLRQLESNFESLAADDPLWTVLSDNSKRGGKWDETEFYQTGEDVIEDLEQRLDQIGHALAGERCIDFGCGVGRLTFPLGKRFQSSIGIDIAPSMVAFAQSRIERGRNCRFIVNASSKLPQFEDATIDFVYSAIVFQHIAPRYTKAYLKEFARCLKPEGLIVFQLPSHLEPNYSGNQKRLRLFRKRFHYRLKALLQRIPFVETESFFEMNAIPKESLAPFLECDCGLEIIDAQDFPAAGPAWISYLYIARKR